MVKKVIAIFHILLPVLLTAMDIGDFYFEKNLYFEAVTEYKRQLYFNQSGKQDELLYKMAMAFYQAEQSHLAEDPLIEAITNSESSMTDREGLKLLATIHWDNYDYEAMRTVLGILSSQSDSTRQNQIVYITAWTYIYQANWQQGVEYLKSVHFTDVSGLIDDIGNVSTVPQKSRKLASLMSNIIPGTGQLYAGDYQNALYSFLLVSSVETSIIWNIIEKACFVAATKYMFLFSRYSRGGMKNLARKIDLDNVDRIGYYLKDVSVKYPNPVDLLQSL
ncbi:MAG: hypothetical protein Q7J65_06800 [Candidatus Marinimicrobia bacterium]|nr:hypothetical protein [Candidatus Neomarinimicrobiota bacterium]